MLGAAPGSMPRLGSSFVARITQLPPVATVVIPCVGFAPAMPLNLAPFGMPGCSMNVSPVWSPFHLVLTGQRDFTAFTVPFVPAFIGSRVVLQALVSDPRAGNAMGAIVSNAGVATVGM
jgi:hypothetical protein